MPRKPKLPNKTALLKVARECAFDPRKPGPLKIIADIDNIPYYENRAIEAIQEAQVAVFNGDQYNLIQQAISLLILSLVKRGQDSQVRPSGSQDSGSSGEQVAP